MENTLSKQDWYICKMVRELLARDNHALTEQSREKIRTKLDEIKGVNQSEIKRIS